MKIISPQVIGRVMGLPTLPEPTHIYAREIDSLSTTENDPAPNMFVV